MKSLPKRLLAGLACLLAMIGFATALHAMTVQPVVLDLTTSGRGMSQVITVENTFDRPLPVELRMEGLELTPDGVRGTGRDSGELAIFPPQAVIQPGQRQNFRVQYVGDPAVTNSRHSFVTVAQLPVQLPESSSNIQLLYNFQVLVSVSPQNVRPQLSVTATEVGRDESGAPVPVITVTNATGAHGYLSRGRIEIVQTDASGREIFRQQMAGAQMQQTIGYGLVGGGQVRRITLPLRLPSADGRITARFTPDA
ncbi:MULTISPECIES: molecular chaperone [unclassified Sphingomonas]|uniref:molecular chaperone n=1 Tax=unclassified Sphingomonas TaxID=196159 RepID=UPI001D1063D5|nr:molecular chaperone [Sphingomonas sp. IC4-52]MCC2980031.1 molecular chaperone [Sphingomonas sp. IC4-52]MCD2314793.1 molecular chaperone [Sphingomonas sp. IC-11]